MNRKKYIYLTRNEMDELLDFVRENKTVLLREIEDDDPILNRAYISETRTTLYITTIWRGVTGRFIYREDSANVTQYCSGCDAYTELSKAYKRATGKKIPDWSHVNESAKAYLGYRKDTDKKRISAICYDIQSAYGWGLLQDMPDTSDIIGRNRMVKDGEVGFVVAKEKSIPGWTGGGARETLQMVLPWEGPATWIFNSMPSPFSRFVEVWYNRKANPKTKEEKAKAKQMIVYAVGYLQRKNPFLRAAVVEWCNRRIFETIDENSIWCNTDCVVSTVAREDIEDDVGDICGQWKIEHNGRFAHSGFSYQWDMDTPSIRGVPKSWFTEGYDILKNDTPEPVYFCRLNTETLRLEDIL